MLQVAYLKNDIEWFFTYSSIVVFLNSLVVLVRGNFLGGGQLFLEIFFLFFFGGDFIGGIMIMKSFVSFALVKNTLEDT